LRALYSCFLFFLEDGSGQLFELNKLRGTPMTIGAPSGAAAGNLALSPSDDATQLFASNGSALLRVDFYDGTTTSIGSISGLEVAECGRCLPTQLSQLAFRAGRRWLTIPTTA
jgi:hypothetical protein